MTQHTPRLFHVSENPSIAEFQPRLSETNPVVSNAVVWAVDEARLANYLLPRDCPRVCYSAVGATTNEDRARFLYGADRVIYIEAENLFSAISSSLTVYEFEPAQFAVVDECAGYWVSNVPVKPSGRFSVSNGVAEIVRRGVELRVVTSLWPIRDAVIQSSLAFSIVRIRNAKTRDAT